MLFHDCLTSQQNASLSQGRIRLHLFIIFSFDVLSHTVTSYCRTHSQYTDSGPTSPITDVANTRFLAGQLQEIQYLSYYSMSGMRCFHKLLGISYRDHITNEDEKAIIRNAIGPYEDLLTSAKRRKLKWHVTRSSGLAKTILQGTV